MQNNKMELLQMSLPAQLMYQIAHIKEHLALESHFQ
jgi:hypothetical protein